MPDLDRVLEAQIAAVDRRVGRRGPYRHEAREIRRAADAVPILRSRLGLGNFLGSLSPDTGKPQYVLLFEAADASTSVLKVYGRVTPAEGAVQKRWTDNGLSCVPTRDHGDDPVSWLQMDYVAGLSLDRTEGWDLKEVTASVADFCHQAHQTDPPDEASSTLAEGVSRHLQVVTSALNERAYSLPSGWEECSEMVYASGVPKLLHGDLFPGNIIQTDDGSLSVIDARGYLGDPAFDLARWVVRIAPADLTEKLVGVWMKHESIDSTVLDGMLAVEFLMQAGVRELTKRERGEEHKLTDKRTMRYLKQASLYLQRWNTRL